MDDRDTFDRKCAARVFELHVIVKAKALAQERNDDEAVKVLERKRLALIAETLDYLCENMEYMDEPTREGFLQCAAQLPIMLEESKLE